MEAVPSAEDLEKLFRHKVLRMLLDEEAIDDSVVKNLLSWAHTGFGAFVGHEIPAGDRVARESVARYLVHPPVAVGRILSDEKAERVVYKADKVHPRHGANFRTFDPLAFIAEVVSHSPNVHEKTAIHYGFYSNRSRGLRKAKGEEASKPGPEGTPGSGAAEGSTAEDDRAPMEVRRNWSRLLCLLRAYVYFLSLLQRGPQQTWLFFPHGVCPEEMTGRMGPTQSANGKRLGRKLAASFRDLTRGRRTSHGPTARWASRISKSNRFISGPGPSPDAPLPPERLREGLPSHRAAGSVLQRRLPREGTRVVLVARRSEVPRHRERQAATTRTVHAISREGATAFAGSTPDARRVGRGRSSRTISGQSV